LCKQAAKKKVMNARERKNKNGRGIEQEQNPLFTIKTSFEVHDIFTFWGSGFTHCSLLLTPQSECQYDYSSPMSLCVISTVRDVSAIFKHRDDRRRQAHSTSILWKAGHTLSQ
jgi:hypothetical protein